MPIFAPFGATIDLMKKDAPDTRAYHHGDLRRTLIDSALSIVTEEQDWGFSLRELARRAGVSHAAPHSHFAEKRDLLIAVAAVGFARLRDRMLEAVQRLKRADKALTAAAQAYVAFATENPALYRLMFGPALADGDATRTAASEIGAEAKAVLEDLVLRGANSGVFTPKPDDALALGVATLSCWSTVHGLANLIIDSKVDTAIPDHKLVDGVMQLFLDGIRTRRPASS
jgi:AcrR family transcriptional regulator